MRSLFVICVFTFSCLIPTNAQVFIPFSYWQDFCKSTAVVFTFTGADQIYTVPFGCKRMRIKAWGGGGGGGGSGDGTGQVGAAGGGGGYSKVEITLTYGTE